MLGFVVGRKCSARPNVGFRVRRRSRGHRLSVVPVFRVNRETRERHGVRDVVAERGLDESVLKAATFYSDSINDLPLLSVVGTPVVVDPDDRLHAAALRHRWRVLRLDRRR